MRDFVKNVAHKNDTLENKWRNIHENPQLSFPLLTKTKPHFDEKNLLKGFCYILHIISEFSYIIEFIRINEWINSIGRIFKDMQDFAYWGKKYFRIFFVNILRYTKSEQIFFNFLTKNIHKWSKGLDAYLWKEFCAQNLHFRRINDAI